MNYNLKQSDEKQSFSTGAQRDSQGDKPRLDLISPVFLDRLGTLLAKGAEHYGERNWEKGIPLSRLLSSAARHLNQTLDGLEDEDHAIQCAFNLMAYVHTLHRIRSGSLPTSLDDLPREKNLEAPLTPDKKPPTIVKFNDGDAIPGPHPVTKTMKAIDESMRKAIDGTKLAPILNRTCWRCRQDLGVIRTKDENC